MAGHGRVDEADLCGGRLDAVGEGRAGEVKVDKRRLGADAPEPPPEEDKGVGVLKVEGDDVAGPDAEVGAQIGAVTQDGVVERAVGVGGGSGGVGRVQEQHRLVGVAGAGGAGLEGVKEVEAVGAAAVDDAGDAPEDAAEHQRVVPERCAGVEVGGGAEGGGHGDGEGDGWRVIGQGSGIRQILGKEREMLPSWENQDATYKTWRRIGCLSWQGE